MKKILALILALGCVFLFSCGKNEVEKTEKPKKETVETQDKAEETQDSEKEEALAEIPKVEVVYETTPEESANKCLEAFKAGDPTKASAYVAPNGKAFKSLGLLKTNMIKAYGVEGNAELTALAEKLVENTLKQYVYTKRETKVNGDKATIVYDVSMPDMAKIDYSKYADNYMASKGITIEQQMMELEGMTEQEMQDWSTKYSLELMNYIFEQGGTFPQKTGTTTVSLEKHEGGWLVSDIINQ